MNLEKLFILFKKLNTGIGYLTGFMMGVMLLSIAVNTVLRYLFKTPLSWPMEISEYILVACTFLPACYTLFENGHIAVDIVYLSFSARQQIYAKMITSFMAIIYCGVLTYESGHLALIAYQKSWVSETGSGVPLFLTYGIVPIGNALLCGGFLVIIVETVLMLSNKNIDKK